VPNPHPDAGKVPLDAPPRLDSAQEIRATNLISIPYGFDSPLPLLMGGREVVASGHGGCTADEQFTVAITITQSTSGAVATGQMEDTCTGKLQDWSGLTTAESTSSLTADAAEACGRATTRADGYVTDTYEWCLGVDLNLLDHQLYFPTILNP
jgi:hypothetical protein